MRYATILLLGLMMLTTPAASAENICGKHEEIVKRLEGGYQEFNTALGISTNGGLIEVYTSEKGTFSIMVTQPDGTSCMVAAGDSWETFKPKPDLGDAY